ncbi:N-acetylmuramoyl-L-alanine amidase [Ktedonospora formicarum]|uniref:N-acetylmuramoyl-L-alanine amidase n=1 Tax=Ktedonospora formicarum TaxID=2778364 RepID=A0A8J3HXH1_9CHLR|nr:N-acetylmuramoyl-L-alanine amidase [Ktedonospora formicarum]GHO42378.1 hypothetical protein KSX_05410 [Ktedonospora formicarum]
MCDQQRSQEQSDQHRSILNRRNVIKLGAGALGVAGLGGLELILASSPAHAAPSLTPTIAGTAKWGAKLAHEAVEILYRRPTKILVHHTATSNSYDTSLAHAYQLSRSIQQAHFNNGWIDTGQHFTVSRGGYIMEGRHRSLETLLDGTRFVYGTHCPVLNSSSIGIEDEGTYTSLLPPTALWNSLVSLCIYICRQYGLTATSIYGHRDFYSTECPGTAFYGRLPALRSQVAAGLGQSLPSYSWPTLEEGTSGENVKSAQFLLQDHGYASLSADGHFGSHTTQTMRQFQAAKGLRADGVLGPRTWVALVKATVYGSTGGAVRAAQTQLDSKGYATSVDGAFGPLTHGVVKRFQSHYKLNADGAVGTATWCALVGGTVGL